MSLFAVLKRNAKLALRNRWGQAILVMLIAVAASVALSILQNIATTIFVPPLESSPAFSEQYGFQDYFFEALMQTRPQEIILISVFSLLSILLISPLNLGSTHWFYQLVHERSPAIGELFRFYESGKAYRRSLWYVINVNIRMLLWGTAFFAVPGGLFGGCVYVLSTIDQEVQRETAALASVGILLAVVLYLLAAIFYSATVNRYALVPYLICDNPDMTVGEAIRTSVSYTKGYRFSLLWFDLSFIGWYILLFAFFPVFYVYPYVNTAHAMYGRYLIEKNRHETQEQMEQTQEFNMDDREKKSVESLRELLVEKGEAPEGASEIPPDGEANTAPIDFAASPYFEQAEPPQPEESDETGFSGSPEPSGDQPFVGYASIYPPEPASGVEPPEDALPDGPPTLEEGKEDRPAEVDDAGEVISAEDSEDGTFSLNGEAPRIKEEPPEIGFLSGYEPLRPDELPTLNLSSDYDRPAKDDESTPPEAEGPEDDGPPRLESDE